MKNICLVDLDDTLIDLKEPMKWAMDSETGKDIPWQNWDHFDVPSIYGLSQDEFLELCIRHKVLENAIIHSQSHRFLQDLNNLGYYTVLITARGWHPQGKEITEQYIIDHNLEVDELILVGVDESKAELARKFGNIKFTIDDRMKHCREYMKSGIVENVLLYDAPWNSYMSRLNPFVGGYDYHERIKNLHEIIRYLARKEDFNVNHKEIKNVC
jgi:hypothetical protein